jgi:uncharacterized UBP type Zn finger protein
LVNTHRLAPSSAPAVLDDEIRDGCCVAVADQRHSAGQVPREVCNAGLDTSTQRCIEHIGGCHSAASRAARTQQTLAQLGTCSCSHQSGFVQPSARQPHILVMPGHLSSCSAVTSKFFCFLCVKLAIGRSNARTHAWLMVTQPVPM